MKLSLSGNLNFTKILVGATVVFVLAASALLIAHVRGTDIHGAIRCGDTARVEAMLAKRPGLAKIRKEYGYTPLLVAAEGGYEEIVELLLKKGSSWSEADYFGNTALHLAARGGQRQVVRILLDYGANFAAKNNQSDTPLHLAADAGHLDIARMLIEAGADIDAKDYRNQTPLQRARDRGRKEVAEFLLKHGAKKQQ